MTLKIIGQALRIISRGTLQVDGEVEGDVAGKEVIIGELGQVTGNSGCRARDCARQDCYPLARERAESMRAS